jgi:hypothetical protein
MWIERASLIAQWSAKFSSAMLFSAVAFGARFHTVPQRTDAIPYGASF